MCEKGREGTKIGPLLFLQSDVDSHAHVLVVVRTDHHIESEDVHRIPGGLSHPGRCHFKIIRSVAIVYPVNVDRHRIIEDTTRVLHIDDTARCVHGGGHISDCISGEYTIQNQKSCQR